MTNKIVSLTDLFNEQVKKDTLVGRLYGRMLYNTGNLFRITLFKGADYFMDDMTGSENYWWTEASEKVEDKFGKGAEFVGYHGEVCANIPDDIDRIRIHMGWNPWTPNEPGLPNQRGYLIPLPKDSDYQRAQNYSLNFYQDAIHSVDVIKGGVTRQTILNPKAE